MSHKAQRPVTRGAGLADLKRLRREADTTPLPSVEKNTNPKRGPAQGRGPSRASTQAQAMLTNDDITLFRQAVRHVQPIKARTRHLAPAPAHNEAAELLRNRREHASGTPFKRPVAISDTYEPATLQHDDSCFVRNRHAIQVIKQLQQGHWPIGATLDLHGSNLEQARDRLDRFLHSCLAHDIRCVRIVHGKGYGSKDGESVLRTTLRRWLTQLQAVQAYAQCTEPDGGAGALHVLLRTSNSIDKP